MCQNVNIESIKEFDRAATDFAVRCFRDQGDKDYIIARKSYRMKFYSHFHWSSLQAIEKYIKCILLFNRISSVKMKHDLMEGLKLLSKIEYFKLNDSSIKMIQYFNDFGLNRYLTWSYNECEYNLHKLDRTIWDIRKYCKSLNAEHLSIELIDFELKKLSKCDLTKPKDMYIQGGFLEKILANKIHPARNDLIWQNGYFLTKSRKSVNHHEVFDFENSPLTLAPQYAEKLSELVYLNNFEINAFKKEHSRRSKNKKNDKH